MDRWPDAGTVAHYVRHDGWALPIGRRRGALPVVCYWHWLEMSVSQLLLQHSALAVQGDPAGLQLWLLP